MIYKRDGQIDTKRWKELAGIITENTSPTYEEDDNDEVNEVEALGGGDPMKLGGIDQKFAKAAYTSGAKDKTGSDDEDKIAGKAKGVKPPVASLKPMQKEVIPEKAVAFAMGFLRDGTPDLGEMEAIISNDNYIMDGHHRWAARTLIDPTAKVDVAKIDLPATELITALNLYTAQIPRKGNTGTGNVEQFPQLVPKVLQKVMDGGTVVLEYPKGPWPKLDAEEAKEAFGKVPGADGDAEKGMKIMAANAKKLPTEKHPDAPNRVDMPVVDRQAEIDKVVAAIGKGQVDIKAPFSKETEKLKTKGQEDEEVEAEMEEKETEEVSEGKKLTRRFKEFF